VKGERWREIERIFDQAAALSAPEQSSFLEETCAGDLDLRNEVESLLAAHARSGDFIDRPSLFFDLKVVVGDAGFAAGDLLGRYRIVKEIGRGGMGAVYLAERADDQYRKQVAIKLIHRGLTSDTMRRRFGTERQILASFDHPNIAHLYDADTAADGSSYFVMEYIDGVAIDKFCHERSSSLKERLSLFRHVCGAVAYAHRHAVIHRDLKPSNILITSEGVPKLLDFGIAKMLETAPSAEALVTIAEARAMTPEYASPEQVRGEAITTASDVYSLGVILYQLLTGTFPYRFNTQSPYEIARVIEGTNPARPSTAVRQRNSRIEKRDSADQRFAFRESRRLRGDLDNIMLMAIRKEPARRYSSVEQFSDDIGRYLEARPVVARKDTFGYRAAKFVRRNRAATAVAALLLLSLIAGIITTSSQAHRARFEQARAERRFNDVRQLANNVLFDYYDAIKNLPGATRVRERLVKDALMHLDSLGKEAGGDRTLQRELAEAYERVGDVLGEEASASLGDRSGAMQSYGKGLALRESLVAAAPGDVTSRRALAASYKKLGAVYLDTAELKKGLDYLAKSLALSSALVAEQPENDDLQRDLAEVHNAAGSAVREGEMNAALEHYRKALPILEALRGRAPKDRRVRRDLSVTYGEIGGVLFLTGDIPGALENNGKALALRESLLAEDPTNNDYRRMLAIAHQNRGDFLAWEKRYPEALESFRRKLDIDEQSLAADPANAQARSDLAYSSERIGALLIATGDAREAVRHLENAVHLYEKATEDDPKDLMKRLRIVIGYMQLGQAWTKAGDYARAQAECGRASELLHQAPDDPANISLQRLRVLAFTGLGDAYAELATKKSTPKSVAQNQQLAHNMFVRGLDLMQDLRRKGILDSDEVKEVDEVARKAETTSSSSAP